MEDLIDVMKKLRSPDGCPWDKVQTLESLSSCLLEEVNETVDAVVSGEHEKVGEEMGDLLCIVSMMIAIGEERGLFTKASVLGGAVEKMVRRHPHVFDKENVKDADDAHKIWHKEKQKEATIKSRKSALDDISERYSALTRADKMQRRAARVGFDWPDVNGAIEKADEELLEMKAELAHSEVDMKKVQEEIGDVLFSVVNIARKLKLDSEVTLRKTNSKFEKRFKAIEDIISDRGLDMESMELAELDRIWDEVKVKEKKESDRG